MAGHYTSGSASSFADLATAIETFLTGSCGWAAAAGATATGVTSRLLSKGAAFVRLGVDTNVGNGPCLFVFGGTGISGVNLVNPSPASSKMGSAAAAPTTFPVSYEVFQSDGPEEVYVVINYNGDKYQNLEWGISDVPDLGATGMWHDGSYPGGEVLTGAAGGTTDKARMYMTGARSPTTDGSGSVYASNYAGLSGGMWMNGDQGSWRGGCVYVGLEGAAAWRNVRGTAVGNIRGQYQSWALMQALPSLFNESEVLLPIRINMVRASSLMTPVAVLRHARMMRMDNVTPGAIITYGSDQWKCYPLYSKNTIQRDGVNWATGAYHSGTVGFAVRYTP